MVCILTIILLPSALAQSSRTYPDQPFNSLQITYSITGADITSTEDHPGFTTARSLKGNLVGDTLTVSGNVVGDAGTNILDVVVSAGESKDFRDTGGRKWTKSFSVSVPVAKDAQSGSFSIRLTGQYGNGETRGLVVSGKFQKPPAKVSYLTIFPINPPTDLPEAQVYTSGDITGKYDTRMFRVTVFGEGGYQVPDGTLVFFSLTDWLGSAGGAYTTPLAYAETKNSEVTITYHPPPDSYWTPSGNHDPSAGTSNRMVIKANCEGKEATYTLYMVRPSENQPGFEAGLAILATLAAVSLIRRRNKRLSPISFLP
jgi:hypothetical protein